MSRPISDVEVGADVEIEGDVIVVVFMVYSICAQTWAAYFHYRAWTPQWLTRHVSITTKGPFPVAKVFGSRLTDSNRLSGEPPAEWGILQATKEYQSGRYKVANLACYVWGLRTEGASSKRLASTRSRCSLARTWSCA